MARRVLITVVVFPAIQDTKCFHFQNLTMRWRVIVGLIFLYAIYLLIGAAVFTTLEYAHEEQKCQDTLDELRRYNLTATRAQNNISGESLREFVQLVLTAAQNGVQFNSLSTPSCAHNWNYQNAFFFAGTVVTTIGYGNIAPTTTGGQTFCMFYATIGLSLFGIMFSAIGDKFAQIFKRFDIKLQKKVHKRRLRKFIVILATLTSLIVFCLLIPSIIFVAVEEWTYHESFYYSFITLTTIGLGDFVVGSNADLYYPSIYRVGVYFWILFGLCFMATVITLVSDMIKDKAQKTRKKNSVKSSPEADDDVTEVNENMRNDVNSVSLELEKSEKVVKQGAVFPTGDDENNSDVVNMSYETDL